ncbi:Periostin [Armadillidium vulgare]|nr:Periostin [Armadillidium vulgare]
MTEGSNPLRTVAKTLQPAATWWQNHALRDFLLYKLTFAKTEECHAFPYDFRVGLPGPFTLFAPTERAFELVSPIFLRRMKNDQNYLRSVLLQHIVLGEVRFPSLLRSDIARTLNGKLLWLTSSSGGYQVNGTMVLQKDIKVSNGVVHVLHNMLMPPDGERITYPIIEKNHHFRNVIDTISANGLKAFERLIDHVALRAILVLDVLDISPFTIFAPTDTAFNSLDPRLIGTLTSDKDLLKDIILQHVVRGRVRENELALGWEGFALNGQNLYSSLLGHDITVSGSRVIIPNIDSQNGIVHVVDRVILPPRAKGIRSSSEPIG